MSQQSVDNIVYPIADTYGIPHWLSDTVIDVESGFNPAAVGDNGTSFGLFQLHEGGQLGNLTPAQAFDVATNARVGLRAIASAWNNLKGSFSNSLGWWEKFAAQSGHPGGAPGQTITDNEAQKLFDTYSNQSGGHMSSGHDWFNFPVTQGHHAGESGIDLGTPNDTPLYFPWGGQVIDARYTTYGGQVAVKIPGTDGIEYFIHLDDIAVHKGDNVGPGQVIGTSGGGIGDKLLHNGVVQPAQSQEWFVANGKQASSGYHTEFGIFKGNTMSDFNAGWYHPQNEYDPTSVVHELAAGQSASFPGSGNPQSVDPSSSGDNPPPGGMDLSGVNAFLSQDWKNILMRVGIGAVGATAIILGGIELSAALREKAG